MITVFENLEEKCAAAVESESFSQLLTKVNKSKKIFLIGNGGLHYVASHMATDMSRLIENKAVFSFDSVGFITSNANDHGYNKIFIRWLETMSTVDNPEDCLIIGLSCSGNSFYRAKVMMQQPGRKLIFSGMTIRRRNELT